MYRWAWLHFVERIFTKPPPKKLAPATQPMTMTPPPIFELPPELLSIIVQTAYDDHVAVAQKKTVKAPHAQLDSGDPNRGPVSLYLEKASSKKNRQMVTFGSPTHRRRAYQSLALVCKAFRPHASRAFYSEVDLLTSDALDAVAAAFKRDPTLARAVGLARLRLGIILAGKLQHPPKRAAIMAKVISEMEFAAHLDVSRLPSPRSHPVLQQTVFHRLSSLALEAPPTYYEIRPLLDHLPALKRLHLSLMLWQSTEEQVAELSAMGPPAFEIEDLSLLLGHDSVVTPAELLHLLGNSHVVKKMSIQLRDDSSPPPVHGDVSARDMIPAEVTDVVRAVMGRYISKVRSPLCP